MARVKHSKTDPASDPSKAHLASVKRNVSRMQPGSVETDPTTGQRVIHPVANPQQVNPISDAAHEKAAVSEAKVLLDKKATPHQKRAATEKSNAAQRAASERKAAAKAKKPSRKKSRPRARRKSRAATAPATPPPGPSTSAPPAAGS